MNFLLKILLQLPALSLMYGGTQSLFGTNVFVTIAICTGVFVLYDLAEHYLGT